MNDERPESIEVPLTSLELKQKLLGHHVRMVARKLSHALFIYGATGGLGKSKTVLTTLEAEGVDPVLINSHVTPLALYGLLFLHREERVLFFDDCDTMYSSMAHLGLLRSALWGSPRIVTYGSSQLPGDLPSSFEFTSRCIFAANVIPKRNDAFKAVLSRCDLFELEGSNFDVISMMRSLASNGFQNVTPDEAATVIDYIEEHCTEKQISMRLLGPAMRKFNYARVEGIDWRPMVLSQLLALGQRKDVNKRSENQTKDHRALLLAISKHPDDVKEQQAIWCKETGKSRATFYRILSKHRDENE
jgi:hypothetical protein